MIAVQSPNLLIPLSFLFLSSISIDLFFFWLWFILSCLYGRLVIPYCMTDVVSRMMLSPGFRCNPLKNAGFLCLDMFKLLEDMFIPLEACF